MGELPCHAVMLCAVERTEITFSSGAARCAGWLYRPQQAGVDAARWNVHRGPAAH